MQSGVVLYTLVLNVIQFVSYSEVTPFKQQHGCTLLFIKGK